MSGITRGLGGAAFVYGLGGVLSRMVSILLLPFFTRHLTPTDYGVIAMLGLMTNLLVGAVSLGTGNSMGICFHEAKDDEVRSDVVWSTSIVVVISALAWALSGAFSSAWVSSLLFRTDIYAVPVALAFGQLAVSAAVVPLLGRWRIEEKTRPYVIATLTLTVTTAIVNFWVVVVLELGLIGMLWSTFLVQASYCIVLYAVFWIKDPPRFAIQWGRRVVRLGWPSIFGVGAFFVLDFGGRFLLERFAGLDALGVFSVGLSFGVVMAILADGAFGAAWPAFFLSYLNKQAEARQVFGRILYYYLVFFLALGTGFFLMAKPVIQLLVAPQFHEAALVVGLVALCPVIKGVYLIFLPGLYFQRKLHIQTMLEWVGASAALAASLILIPAYGMVGAALAAVFGYLVLGASAYVVSQRYLKTVYEFRRIIPLVLSFLVIVSISFSSLGSGWGEWAIRSALFLAYSGFVWAVFLRRYWYDLVNEFKPA